MNGNEKERIMILTMVSEGKISAEDGARLLAALSGAPTSRPPVEPPPAPQAAKPPAGSPEFASDSEEELPPELTTYPNGRPRFLRVRVTDMRSGRAKVTVNLPMAMVRWGLRVGAHYAPEVNDFNMDELADLLEQGYSGKLVDVMDEEDGEHVEVFID